MINIEIRERIFIYFEEISGIGGLPCWNSKSWYASLSGGIDSIAGYLMAKEDAN